MNGGDHAVLDFEILVNDLDEWGEAVGGAGGSGDYCVLLCVVEFLHMVSGC